MPVPGENDTSWREWRRDVYRRYVALSKLTQEHAKLEFLRILSSLPYGNSLFFSVKRIEDPIGLPPSKLILGINKRGVHFFRPVPKEYLHSAELRDIMQFGSSSHAIFFKMRVAGVLHIFQFETRQGDDICMALQTHITDIMMKRYAKAKEHRRPANSTGLAQANSTGLAQANSTGLAQANSTGLAQANSTGLAQANSTGLAQANFGPKYDQHLKKMQKDVEEASMRIEELEKEEKEASYKVQEMRNQLEGIRTNLTSYESQKMELHSEISAARKAIGAAKEELHDIQAVCRPHV